MATRRRKRTNRLDYVNEEDLQMQAFSRAAEGIRTLDLLHGKQGVWFLFGADIPCKCMGSRGSVSFCNCPAFTAKSRGFVDRMWTRGACSVPAGSRLRPPNYESLNEAVLAGCRQRHTSKLRNIPPVDKLLVDHDLWRAASAASGSTGVAHQKQRERNAKQRSDDPEEHEGDRRVDSVDHPRAVGELEAYVLGQPAS
jgi:hypothetical protein